ncbi:hypothetical protein HZH68_004552 [Vespula germanica]|uniref:Uncharacterized protein n=1 Tax=Vespula germanica TaxID=30212 RepID=A0A834KQS1_VESGE|nr:hypothetical protein HZH68_004552 [Vespula germanica]
MRLRFRNYFPMDDSIEDSNYTHIMHYNNNNNNDNDNNNDNSNSNKPRQIMPLKAARKVDKISLFIYS